MRELSTDTPDGLAYRTFRIWSDFWQAQDDFTGRTPPLHHYGNTSRGGALIIAPASEDEVKAFISSCRRESGLRYKLETSVLGTDWIGFWCLFSVSLEVVGF